jgi:hypothetical protein
MQQAVAAMSCPRYGSRDHDLSTSCAAADIEFVRYNQRLNVSILVAFIVVAVCSSARNASAQPYATAAIGIAQQSLECSTLATCDESDVAFKLIGGYRFASWVGAEATFFDFGEHRRTSRISEDNTKTSAFGGGIAFHANVSAWTLTVRGGGARTAASRRVKIAQIDSTVTFHHLAPYGGLAIGYRFSDYVAMTFAVDAMRTRWERSDGLGVDWNIAAATAGITIGR